MTACERRVDHRESAEAPGEPPGPRVLAEPRGAARDGGLPRAPPPRVPGADRLGRRPPRASGAHGRLDRARGPDRLHAPADRADLPLRQAARRRSSRASRSSTPRRTSTAATRAACSPKSYEGRPIKIEGNELHPASLGGTDVFAQASILNMYDPDRSQTLLGARADPALERAARGRQAGPRAGAAAPGRGAAPADDDRHLAHAAGADRRRPRRAARGEVDRLGAGRARERLRGHEARVRRGAAAASTRSTRPT